MRQPRRPSHEHTGPLHHPVMTVKAVHFRDDWKSILWRYPVWLDFGRDQNDGWHRAFTPEVERLLENSDANMLFWAHIYVKHGDPCEIATVRTDTSTGESTMSPIPEEPEEDDRGRLLAIHGKDAVLVFVTPHNRGFKILFYEPRVHTDEGGVPLNPFLTGRRYRHYAWVKKSVSEENPFLDNYAYLADVVQKLVVRCENRVAAREAEMRSRRSAPARSSGTISARMEESFPFDFSPDPEPLPDTDSDIMPSQSRSDERWSRGDVELPFIEPLFRWLWRKVPFVHSSA